MWGKGKTRKSGSARLDTVIGKTTSIKGDINFAGNLHIEGTVVGSVKSDADENATLVLDEDGMIEGDVDVANLMINGTVQGDIFSSGHTELLPNARIAGNVYYNLIEMAVGSEVNGNLVHRREEEPAGQIEYLDSKGKYETNSKS